MHLVFGHLGHRYLLTIIFTVTAAEREGILPGLANVDLVKADLGHAVDNLPIPYFANQKAKRIFGIRFRTVPDTLKGVVDDFSARGWLKHLEA